MYLIHPTIGVGIGFRGCMHHAIKRLKEVVYLNAVGHAAGFYKVGLTLHQIGFTGLALQDNKVTAHFGSGVISKKVIGQAVDRNWFAMFHQPLAHWAVLFCIEYILRSDKSHYTTITHHID